jgi:general secretion pathway protein G
MPFRPDASPPGPPRRPILTGILVAVGGFVLAILISLAVDLIRHRGYPFLVPAPPRTNDAVMQIREIGRALETYKKDVGHYPTEAEGGLRALKEKPDFADAGLAATWFGPYLNETTDIRDHWGRLLEYEVAPPDPAEQQEAPYWLWSDGPDGQSGTDDDIDLWTLPKATR